MNEHWLHSYLLESVDGQLCTKPFCTTCGALDFRKGIRRQLSIHVGKPVPFTLTDDDALAICRELSLVVPSADEELKLDEALRCLLCDVAGSIDQRVMAEALGNSWAGIVLRRMRDHSRDREQESRRRKDFESPVACAERRRIRAEARRAAAELRQARKRDLDQAWHASHGSVPRRPRDG